MEKRKSGRKKEVMVEGRKTTYSRMKVQFVRLGEYIESLQRSLGLSARQVYMGSHMSHALYEQVLEGVAKSLDVYFRLMRFFMTKLVQEEYFQIFKRCCVCCLADMFGNYGSVSTRVEKPVPV